MSKPNIPTINEDEFDDDFWDAITHGRTETVSRKVSYPFIRQDEDTFEACLGWFQTGVLRKKTAPETKHQKKVIDFLEKEGFETIKLIVSNKAGNSDIVACSPAGQFWKIEVKHEEYNPTALQLTKLRKFWKKNAVAMVAYGFEDFKLKYSSLVA